MFEHEARALQKRLVFLAALGGVSGPPCGSNYRNSVSDLTGADLLHQQKQRLGALQERPVTAAAAETKSKNVTGAYQRLVGFAAAGKTPRSVALQECLVAPAAPAGASYAPVAADTASGNVTPVSSGSRNSRQNTRPRCMSDLWLLQHRQVLRTRSIPTEAFRAEIHLLRSTSVTLFLF